MKKTNILEKIKSIGYSVLGILIMGAFFLLAYLFFTGGIALGIKILPWLFNITGFVFLVDILILLPLLMLNKTRSITSIGLLISSYIFGVTLWFWGLILTFYYWGFLAVIIGLFIFGVGVVPIALLATIINTEWSLVGQIILMILFTYGSRYYAFHIAKKIDEDYYIETSQVIDREIISENEDEKSIENIYCIHCGVQNSKEAKFCFECGKKIN